MAPACACWQPLAMASDGLRGIGEELAALVRQRGGAFVQRAEHEADAGHDDAALEHAFRREEVDRGRGAAYDDHRRPRTEQVTRADQRRPAVAAELLRVAVAVDDAALHVLRHEPVRRRRIGPHLEHADRVGAHARAGDVGDHDARGCRQLGELHRQRRDFLQQGVPGLDAVLARRARRADGRNSPHLRNVFPTSISRMKSRSGIMGRCGRSKLTSDRAERSAGSACGTDRRRGRRW